MKDSLAAVYRLEFLILIPVVVVVYNWWKVSIGSGDKVLDVCLRDGMPSRRSAPVMTQFSNVIIQQVSMYLCRFVQLMQSGQDKKVAILSAPL